MQQKGESSSGRWRLGHRPALDGLRGIAVLLVVATHFDEGQVTLGGVIGVKMFFALSGFLITSLLLEEYHHHGSISMGNFYLRRALRLFPALAAMLVVVTTLTIAGWPTGVRLPMVVAVMSYVSNWYLLASSNGGSIHWSAIGHTWSLAIEEQFYVVWPLVVLTVRKIGGLSGLRAATTAGALGSLAWGLLSGRSALASDVSAWCLLVGCWLAVAMQQIEPRVNWSRSWPAACALVALAPLIVGSSEAEEWIAHAMAPVVAVIVIWFAATRPVAWLEIRWLRWVGRRSYGLYLWHVPVAYVLTYVAGPWLLLAGCGIVTSFLLACASWRLVEAPILKFKAVSETRGPMPSGRALSR